MNENTIIIQGRLAADPELKHLPNGTMLANFRIGNNQRHKVGDQWEEKGHFFDCKAFGKTAEFLSNHFYKGKPIHINGMLQQESWKNNEGQNRSKCVILANKIRFLESKGDDQGGRATDGGRGSRTDKQHQPRNAQKILSDAGIETTAMGEDEIPF